MRREALLCQNDSVLTAFVTTANVRFRNGETNRLELMNAQRMKAENTMQRQEAQNERSAAVSGPSDPEQPLPMQE